VYDAIIHVAYERPTPHGTEIVVSDRATGGTFFEKTVVAEGGAALEEPVLHVMGGTVWLDWKNSETSFAWSLHEDGEWSAPSLLPWTNFTWLGFEEARIVTEGEVLGQ
jgi:hypothetical protein